MPSFTVTGMKSLPMRMMLKTAALGGFALIAIAAPAMAQNAVSLESAVFVERTGQTGDGRVERRIEPATRLTRGDKVVLMVEWQAQNAGKGFAVTSPVPRTLAFQNASLDHAEVSADGGRSWGKLGELKVKDGGTLRLATPEDVTDLRWRVSEREAALGRGRITYSAIVR